MFLQGFANEFGGRPFLEAIGPCAACSDVNHSSLLKYGSKTWWSPHIFLDPCNPPWIPASCWSNRQFLLQICIYCLKNWTSNSCSLKKCSWTNNSRTCINFTTSLPSCKIWSWCMWLLQNQRQGAQQRILRWCFTGTETHWVMRNHKSKTTTNTERVPSGKLT